MNQKFYLLHSDMFVIQFIARGMEKARLEAEIEIISRNISKVASKLSGNQANDSLNRADSRRRFDKSKRSVRLWTRAAGLRLRCVRTCDFRNGRRKQHDPYFR